MCESVSAGMRVHRHQTRVATVEACVSRLPIREHVVEVCMQARSAQTLDVHQMDIVVLKRQHALRTKGLLSETPMIVDVGSVKIGTHNWLASKAHSGPKESTHL
jgi:hypothetical protein